jgi:hypothetical protein
MKSSVVGASVFAIAAGLILVAIPAPVAQAAGPFQYHSVTPCRVVDTRTPANAPILATNVVRTFTFQGNCGVPAGAKAVSINTTAVGPNGAGFLTLYPAGTSQPVVSNINFNAFEPALGNGAIVPLAAATPDLAVFPFVNVGGGAVHMVIDVTGYFQ